MTQQVGTLSANVIAALGLPLQAGQPILLGSGNISPHDEPPPRRLCQIRALHTHNPCQP